MENNKIIVRWTDEGWNFCNIFLKKDIREKMNSSMRDYPHKFQTSLEELEEAITGAVSIYFNLDSVKKEDLSPIIVEYWFQDGNTGAWISSKNECIKNILFNVFKFKENTNRIIIPDTYKLKYVKNSREYSKEVSRKEIKDMFGEYVTIDTLNNGISKKIVAINFYARELFVNFDNTSEINSLYYKTYFDELGTVGISIPYIHRNMWKCIKKLCNIEEEK